jgi:hypothetical protein
MERHGDEEIRLTKGRVAGDETGELGREAGEDLAPAAVLRLVQEGEERRAGRESRVDRDASEKRGRWAPARAERVLPASRAHEVLPAWKARVAGEAERRIEEIQELGCEAR